MDMVIDSASRLQSSPFTNLVGCRLYSSGDVTCHEFGEKFDELIHEVCSLLAR